MRFASQQKVTGRSWMIVRSGSTVSFESPQAACATGLPSRKSATGWRCIHKSTKAMNSGQTVEVARPSRRDDQSDVTPTSHGMRIPPRFPKAASNPNIVAPPRGKRSAATPSVVGHRQLPARPTAMLAARATAGQGAKQASRKSTTEGQQQGNRDKSQGNRAPSDAPSKCERTHQDRDHGSNSIKRMQPVQGRCAIVRLQSGNDRTEHHVQDPGAEAHDEHRNQNYGITG